jgi:hypothetical protein
VDEHYAICVALLKVSGCDEEANVQPEDEENCRWDGKPGNEFTGQRIEHSR